MSFCRGCGSEVEEELTICPNCGAKIEKKNKNVNLVSNQGGTNNIEENYFYERPVYYKNISVFFILTFLTCGLFGILYWQFCITNDMNKLTKSKGINGIQYILFTLLTCGLYNYVWHYNMGSKIEKVKYSGNDRGLLFLILTILGLWWINDILLQQAINSKAEYTNY